MPSIHRATFLSKIGPIEITGTRQGIRSLRFVEKANPHSGNPPETLIPCINELTEYFKGNRTTFSITLDVQGTAFEKKVWIALLNIPYGETRSYGQIARTVGHPKACRAVGNTNRKNRIAILIPCHRVIGGNGSLTGYASGLWRKEWLLAHEKKHRSKWESHDI